MASSTELHTPAMISNKKNFLDLPSETIALILENVGGIVSISVQTS